MGGKHWFLLSHIIIGLLCILLIMSKICLSGNPQYIGKVSPGGIKGSRTNWIDMDGKFLVSNNGEFALGFVATATNDFTNTKFLVGVVHVATATLLWSGNRALPVSNSDNFVFDDNGNAFLQKNGTVVWSTNTTDKGVSSMELQDTGNFVLLGKDGKTIIWQSFSYPTDTLMPNQDFTEGHFTAKVSDFGLAKLMNREQSHVFTTLRGTRGYLAPEWLKNYAISEKSDVYSYGMVLLEIIGGRKNYDPNETSEKSNFPAFAFKMMEEGKVKEILDSELKIDENDDRVHCAIKVALWCIQEDASMRPSMIKVVQMLVGICTVPKPPTSEGGTSSGTLVCNSDANKSAVSLSGPR